MGKLHFFWKLKNDGLLTKATPAALNKRATFENWFPVINVADASRRLLAKTYQENKLRVSSWCKLSHDELVTEHHINMLNDLLIHNVNVRFWKRKKITPILTFLWPLPYLGDEHQAPQWPRSHDHESCIEQPIRWWVILIGSRQTRQLSPSSSMRSLTDTITLIDVTRSMRDDSILPNDVPISVWSTIESWANLYYHKHITDNSQPTTIHAHN